MTPSTRSATWKTPSTSSCRCSPISTVTSFTSASATVRSSGAIRSCGRRRRPRFRSRACGNTRGGSARSQSDRLRLCRHDRVSRRGRRVLLSRDEHADSGRAYRQRDDLADSTSCANRSASPRASRSALPKRRLHCVASRSKAASTRRIPRRIFALHRARIAAYREPAGLGVRVDSAAYAGWTIPPDYDSLVAKLIVWAPTRDRALARLRRAIDEYVIEGVPTTLPLLRALCDHPAVLDGSYGTATLERFAATFTPPARNGLRLPASTPPPPRRRLAPRLGSLRPRSEQARASGGNDVTSPMHGLVVELLVAKGDEVREGQVVAIVEAMKMMNEIPRASHRRRRRPARRRRSDRRERLAAGKYYLATAARVAVVFSPF